MCWGHSNRQIVAENLASYPCCDGSSWPRVVVVMAQEAVPLLSACGRKFWGHSTGGGQKWLWVAFTVDSQIDGRGGASEISRLGGHQVVDRALVLERPMPVHYMTCRNDNTACWHWISSEKLTKTEEERRLPSRLVDSNQ
uniref:Uncharacterized protein n=1 Tax=Romanomermis culicivorax TaxID=13658 RepID=A0A915KDK9_ROMCU